jgi:mercuric reductase
MENIPDLIILGSGSTAFAAALRATNYGARVLMFEKSVMGGTCINWGCIPSKTLIHAALFKHEAQLGDKLGLGIKGSGPVADSELLFRHREKVVTLLRKERYLDVLKNMKGLEMIKGTARFIDSGTVECDDIRYRADSFLIAVGGNPHIPALPGLDKCDYCTSRSALLLHNIPESIVIVGGGVVAVELGQMYHRLGCQVTILEHGARLLAGIEEELSATLEEIFVKEGIRVVLNASIRKVDKVENLNVVYVDVNEKPIEFTCEKLLLATGSQPATDGIGLDKAGVHIDPQGYIVTDNRMRTSVDTIWAAGDVINKIKIATVGAKEGIVAVDDMFNKSCGCEMDYLAAPMAIFTDPEVGMIGHGEKSAGQANIDIVVNSMSVSSIPKAQVTGHTVGVIKMIAEKESGRLLGVHLICHRGADLINEASLAIRMKATVTDIANTMHVYPSIGEGLKLCAQGFSRDISLLSCCAE